MNQIIESIKEKISNYKKDGRKYLLLIQNNESTLGDESGAIHLIYEENRPNINVDEEKAMEYENELFEFYKSLYKQIELEMQKETQYRNVKLPESISSSASLVYVSNCNDLFKIQITDEHLHIIQFYSGQY